MIQDLWCVQFFVFFSLQFLKGIAEKDSVVSKNEAKEKLSAKIANIFQLFH